MFSFFNAPEFPETGVEWLNTEEPVSLAKLRGRIVVIEFWTLCCVNCIHTVPIMKQAEAKFPDDVVVIAVHSPKFTSEKNSDNVRHAIARLGIAHPVVHDPDRRIWQDYKIRAWPTLVIVSPTGKIIQKMSGEPNAFQFMHLMDRLVRKHCKGETIDAIGISLKPPRGSPARFNYPSKIKPMPGEQSRWAVSDSGHNQIVVLDDGGAELKRFGSGIAGLTDGAGQAAQFNGPQGLICNQDHIFVADTNNHALRVIDIKENMVTTIAGTGARGQLLYGTTSAKSTFLASPWDLEIQGDNLYFANAGTHQIGCLNLKAQSLEPIAGNGYEDLSDGPALDAKFAQPSGLALNPKGTVLFVADSEASAIRLVYLTGKRQVRTLVGKGLLTFGRANGGLGEALFQHAMGLAPLGNGLVVADSYNNALRHIRLDQSVVEDFGAEFVCKDKLCLPLNEPAGLCVATDGRVLVADTNNHRILVYSIGARSYRTWA